MIGTALTLTGDLEAESAIPWIVHRGLLLNLDGWVRRRGAGEIEIALAGPEPLVAAMEAACSLGPADILVEHITRQAHDFDHAPGRFRHLS
ncbi:acylphosphatase [uncultured Roseobacter sp.]|uniref:acylphosphatase n=1 Tax=uncultured Roseobacter sp. TaxID=114847 RepID=UPI002611A1D7|nr:acylphosphatase [uncultured Roseobacter sp.]